MAESTLHPGELRSRPESLATFAAIAGGLLGLALALGFAPYQVDDAFIFYRYAEHLLAGRGFEFSAGVPPVEGFTAISWLAALTFLAGVFGSEALPDLGLSLGLAALAVCLVLGWIAGGTGSRVGGLSGAIVVVALALCPALVYYAATGMDPVLFAIVVVATAACAAGRLPLALGVAAGLVAIWARPEGAWIPVALACQAACTGRWAPAEHRRLLWLVGAIVLGGVALVSVRWLTFGELLPNTYYAKEPSRTAGLAYVASTFSAPWALGLALFGVAGAVSGERVHRGYLAAAASWIVAAVLEGGDWMRLGRMLIPAFVMLGFAAGGLGRVLQAERSANRRARFALGAFALAWAAACLSTIENEQRIAHTTFATLGAEERQIARWLHPSPVQSVALIDIGLLGWTTGLEIVDLGGLTDARIARTPGGHLDKQFDLSYVFDERRPDAIVIRLRNAPAAGPDGEPVTRPLDAESSVEARMLADPRMPRDYRFALALLPDYPRSLYYGRLLFVRKTLDPRFPPGHAFAPSGNGPRVVASQPGGDLRAIATSERPLAALP